MTDTRVLLGIPSGGSVKTNRSRIGDGKLGYVVGDFMGDLMEPRRKFVYWKTSRIGSCNSTGDRTNVTWLVELSQ